MHSFQGKNHSYHFDAGLTGDVVIADSATGETVAVIKASELLKLVAEEYVRYNRTVQLEQISWKDLLK